MTFVLGLTGGIATGKSTADQILKSKGIPVIDADQIAHQLLAVGQAGWQNVKQAFGPAYLLPDQRINRQKLGNYVFEHPRALKKLTGLNVPLIIAKIEEEIKSYRAQKKGLIVLDAPTLFENKLQHLCSAVVVITLPQKLEIERLRQRNHLTDQQARARIQSQMPLKEKERLADYVIANTGTIKELEQKMCLLLNKISEA